MARSSTTSVPMGSHTIAPRNTLQAQGSSARKTVASDNTVTKDGQDVRQGKRGSRMIYVLAASVMLLLILYALIGVFSDTILVTDLGTSATGEAALPGPTAAQETIITDPQ